MGLIRGCRDVVRAQAAPSGLKPIYSIGTINARKNGQSAASPRLFPESHRAVVDNSRVRFAAITRRSFNGKEMTM